MSIDTDRAPERTDWFVRTAEVVGDFGNPFYAEERQRDVWNEACAFGLQLLLWTSWLAATIAVWTVGAPAVPYTIAFTGLVGWVGVAVMVYARRLGVDPYAGSKLRRIPTVAVSVLLVSLIAGMVHGLWSTRLFGLDSTPVITGFIAGAVVGAATVVFQLLRARRRARHAADTD
jgi:hypothetical protein